jgi:hypothetical protein
MAIDIQRRPEGDDSFSEDAASGTVTVALAYKFTGTNNIDELRTQMLVSTDLAVAYNGRTLWRSGWTPHFQPGEWGTFEVQYTSQIQEGHALQAEGPPGEGGSPPPPPPPNTPSDTTPLGVNWSLATKGGTTNVKLSKQQVSRTLAVKRWQPATAYKKGDIVQNHGETYKATVAGTSAVYEAWLPNEEYTAGLFVVRDGEEYVCVTAGMSGGTGPSGTTTGIIDGTARWDDVGPVGPSGTGSGITDGGVTWDHMAAQSAPDVGRLVGISDDGVKGVDVPALACQVSIELPVALYLPLVRTLSRIDEPQTNSGPWLGWDAGELLYTGCEARGDEGGKGTLTLHIDGGTNLYAGDARLTIDDSLTLPGKMAHDYVDVIVSEGIVSGVRTSIPQFAVVHRMFDSMSFSEVFGFG